MSKLKCQKNDQTTNAEAVKFLLDRPATIRHSALVILSTLDISVQKETPDRSMYVPCGYAVGV